MSYDIYKYLHVLGVILLLGNVTVTSVWKVFADRSRVPATIAFAQRMVTGTDWGLTVTGFVLTIVGGYGMAFVGGFPLVAAGWMLWSQVMFVLAGALWACVLLPIQVRQARLTREHEHARTMPEAYWRLSRRWLVWGLIATVPLTIALWMMLVKMPA